LFLIEIILKHYRKTDKPYYFLLNKTFNKKTTSVLFKNHSVYE